MIPLILFTSMILFNMGESVPTTPSTESYPMADNFKDILSVIPKDLIKNITYEHLKDDEGFKAAVKFMQSDEWNERIKIIREKPEWIALKKYMKNFGIHMDSFIKCADGFIKNITVTLDNVDPPPKKSLRKFLIDLEENLPTMKILTAVHEKMIQNPKFLILFDKISSTDTRKLIDNVLSIDEIRSMMKDLADMDLNIIDALTLVYAFLGWGELKFK